ncbi:MAG: hypothetical protein AB8B84_08915 [Granulosicoccus sp.]
MLSDTARKPARGGLSYLCQSFVLGAMLAPLWFSNDVLALEFYCESPDEARYLRAEIPGSERLCEVTVNYENTGERRVLWYAEHDTLFCSAKIYALKDKYENQWNFTCEQWPDLDGIDQLSPSNRQILDTQLRAVIEKGKSANPGFKVNSVKAVASTLLDKQPGTLAIQFLLSSGDLTQVIVDDGSSWELVSTVKDLASHVSADIPVTTAFISSVSDSGALEIQTTLQSEAAQNCFGNQVIAASAQNSVNPQTSHEYICDASILAENDVQ